MSLKIKESELKDILDEVASDLAKAFESEKDALKKAELAKDDAPGGDESPDEDAGSGPPAEGSESAPPADASASAPPDAGAGGPPPPDASASPDGAPAPEGMDPAAEQAAALTPEALQAEYGKLAPEELDMHIKAALSAKAAIAGAPGAPGVPGAPDAGGLPPPDASAAPMPPDAGGLPPPGPSAPPMAPPAGGPPGLPPGPPAMKAELKASPERNGKHSIDALGKSANEYISKKYEDEISELRALAKSQQEDVENLTKILTKVLEQPLRKAVTTVAHLPKVEEKRELNAVNIHARLKELSAKPDLKKSDRQLINDFYDGRVKADKLAPLFEDFK